MKSTNKIFKLADKFTLKLQKYAQTAEVDSSAVTLAVRPTVNNVLTKMNFNAAITKAIQDVANKIAAVNQEMHGSIKIDTFVTNAVGGVGKWKINPANSGLKFGGSLSLDKSAGPALKQFISKVNAAIIPVLEKEFNRISLMDKEGWAGNKITNHETNVNEVNLDV